MRRLLFAFLVVLLGAGPVLGVICTGCADGCPMEAASPVEEVPSATGSDHCSDAASVSEGAGARPEVERLADGSDCCLDGPSGPGASPTAATSVSLDLSVAPFQDSVSTAVPERRATVQSRAPELPPRAPLFTLLASLLL